MLGRKAAFLLYTVQQADEENTCLVLRSRIEQDLLYPCIISLRCQIRRTPCAHASPASWPPLPQSEPDASASTPSSYSQSSSQ